MGHNDHTDMGGAGGAFLTTHWSLIERVGPDDNESNRALIGLLLKKYWKPVYCYLRRRGYENEKAKDLTQGFFHEVVLSRKLIQRADQSKGRFRTFLLTALARYLINVREQENAQKRIPPKKLVSLDMTNPPILPEAVMESTPEEAYDYVWVSSLLERVLEEVEKGCHEQGKTVHWQVFHDRVLQPIMKRTDAPTMKEICHKYGIESGIKASSMIVTVKRRFRAAFEKHIRDSVVSDEQAEEELHQITRFFPGLAQYGG